MNCISMNKIPAKVSGTPNHLWLELSDTTRFYLPKEHQSRLTDYLNQPVEFGISANFIRLAQQHEKLNVCHGKLEYIDTTSDKQTLHLTMFDNPITVCLHHGQVYPNSIGQSLKLNFDTYFGHVFDLDTQLNLTI